MKFEITFIYIFTLQKYDISFIPPNFSGEKVGGWRMGKNWNASRLWKRGGICYL